MKGWSTSIRKILTGSLALAIGVMCLAAPGRAAEAAPEPARRSIATLSPRALALLTAHAAQPDPASAESSAFFKTKKGAAVLVLLGAGFGYALYSRSHDEIKSAIRQ